jgi:protein-tyrosine-phosphatase
MFFFPTYFMKKQFKIHVICLGNIARSPAAEYLLQYYLDIEKKQRKSDISVKVSSSGLNGGYYSEMESYSEGYLQTKGIKVKEFISRKTSPEILKDQDLVLTMETYMIKSISNMVNNAKIMSYRAAAGEKGDIEDPYDLPKGPYFEIMNQIDDCSKKIAKLFYDGKLIQFGESTE